MTSQDIHIEFDVGWGAVIAAIVIAIGLGHLGGCEQDSATMEKTPTPPAAGEEE